MSTPIPTPIGIINPQPGALEPSLLAWLSLLVSGIAALTVITFRQRPSSPRSLNRTLLSLVDELRRISSFPENTNSTERATRVARRIISSFIETDTSSMSCIELRLFAGSLNVGEQTESLSKAILLLADIEELAYAPPEPTAMTSQLQPILERLVSLLSEHVRRFKPL